MPIYEFYCPDNNKIYSFFARSASYADKVPPCPDNPSYRMQRTISNFAVKSSETTTSFEAPTLGQDDAKMEAAMQVMEREFASLSESENPDPRTLGKMMRRMSEVSGEKITGSMDEMIRRMEAGEDPESLEENFTDMDINEEASGTKSIPGSSGLESLPKQALSMQKFPIRDPNLYDFI